MKPLYRFSILPLLAVLLFTSCQQKVPVQVQYIPKQANIVASLNTAELKSKLLKANFTPATIFNFMQQQGTADSNVATAKQTWNDIKQSGIDIEGGLFAYSYEKGSVSEPDNGMVNGMVLGMKDAQQFNQTIQTKMKNKPVQKGADFDYVRMDTNQLLAWNDKVVMLVSYSSLDTSKPYFDSATQKIIFQAADTLQTDSLKIVEEVSNYFHLKTSQSMADYKQYQNLINQKTDGTLWYNLANKIAPFVMLSAKADALFSDVFLTATFNFEEGAVAFETNILTNDRLADVLAKYSGKGIDSATLLAYPSNDINLLNAFAFNPELINGLLKEMDLENSADAFLKQADSTLSIKDFSNALGGNINVFLSDFTLPEINVNNIKRNKDSLQKLMPSAKFLFYASVQDSAAMNRLLSKWTKKDSINTNTKSAVQDILGFKWQYDATKMLLSNDSAVAAQFLAGTGKANIPTDVLQQAQGKAGFFYLDIAKVFGKPQLSDTAQNSGLAKARMVFRDVRGTMNNIKGNTIKGRFELRLKQDKTNSLVTLIQMLTGFVSLTAVEDGVIKVNEAQLLDIPSRLGMM
jgi:hypothetical protein